MLELLDQAQRRVLHHPPIQGTTQEAREVSIHILAMGLHSHLEGDGLGELSSSAGIGGSDLDRLHLDEHLVVLAGGLGAGVLLACNMNMSVLSSCVCACRVHMPYKRCVCIYLVGSATLAAAVVEDCDDGSAARLERQRGSTCVSRAQLRTEAER